MMDTVEHIARVLARHYGPEFDNCARDRAELRQLIMAGRNSDINEPTQVDHLEAARAIIKAIPTLNAARVGLTPGEETEQ